jgi:hypothetical protein
MGCRPRNSCARYVSTRRRIEIDDDPGGDLIGYRLTDEYAEEIRRVAAEKSEGARWN